MTNLEWVLENQEKLIKENLYVDRAIDIALGKIALEEVLSWNLSVNVEQQKLVKTEASQQGDKRYIYYNTGVKEWLQAERKKSLAPAYPRGTVLVSSNGSWYWYSGVNQDATYHVVYNNPAGLTKMNPWYKEVIDDEIFKHNFEPLNPNVVVDHKRNLIVAPCEAKD